MVEVERSGERHVVGRVGSGRQEDQGEPNARFEFGERGRKHLQSAARAVRRPVSLR